MQVLRLFPSAQGLEVVWHSIVKIGQSLYNEGPGMDPYRPDQQTPVHRMFLAGSYTKQDYIDSMCALHPLRRSQKQSWKRGRSAFCGFPVPVCGCAAAAPSLCRVKSP